MIATYQVEGFEVVTVSKTFLIFSWSAPNTTAQPTTGYRLTCVPLLEGVFISQSLIVDSTATTANMTRLYSGVAYNCSIHVEGSTQIATVISTTAESGSYIAIVASTIVYTISE